MTALIIIASILLFIVLLLSVRVRLLVQGTDDFRLALKVFFIKIPLYPRKKSPGKIVKSRKKEKKKQEKKEKLSAGAKEHPTAKRKPADALRMVKLATYVLKSVYRRFPRYFKLRLKKLIITVGGPDAAQTAIRYGAVRAAVAYLATVAETFVTVKTPRNAALAVSADFLTDKSSCDMDIELSTSLRSLIHLAVRALFAFLHRRRQFSKKSTTHADKSQLKEI